MVAKLFGSKPTEIWFGDSHAMYYTRSRPSSYPVLTEDGLIVWHLGPRLMYSLAIKGFGPLPLRAARWVSRLGRRGALLPVFTAGEIDARAHLAPRAAAGDLDVSFVAQFVTRGCELAALLKSRTAVFVSAPPESDIVPAELAYSVNGTIEERVMAQRRLTAALASAVAAHTGPVLAVCVDATDLLADDAGVLRHDLTDDGHHVNARGAALVRSRIDEALNTVALGQPA
jgi:hypothetical protein